ncbi:threonine dehydrogenase-like Zn-dependent dehydrogenase [Nocardiopsis sp. Huas11]|uniref:zinc-dependent alcohol dehydrogenase n=1 Tax=Nocardiopsis sp. Huas11 TaxID=2183912 RepID=UPI000EB57214|nr:zinc-binding alcohol dehydrogenase [Nocardiopsis sp. Huas11]RKS09062.1 threonine dehydrogenase-like Zn-dependent dehydrogenase [Nocardiopsis sp. Huas11]
MGEQARAFWVRAPGVGEIRTAELPEPGRGEVRVRALYSGVSRGTETLVFQGRVPERLHRVMRAPFQEGYFPGPVKYGYLNVGVVEEGPEDAVGRTVFTLYPHQTRFVLPAGALRFVPEGVPPARAILAGTVETAVNALWDAAPRLGDRVTVIGAGMVGCCVARLLARVPGTRVELIDVDPARARVAERLGVGFAAPEEAADDRDLVFHTSATEEGLALALRVAATDGEVVELSWYGDRPVSVPLGEDFHSRRITLRSSQVGGVAAARRGRRGYGERLDLALELLADPAFDALLTGESSFDDLPAVLPRLADGSLPALCHRIVYP